MSAHTPTECGALAAAVVENALDVALEIARRGYAAPVIRLAVLRKGLMPQTAEAIAIIALRMAKASAVAEIPVSMPATRPRDSDPYADSNGRAAVWALRGLTQFVFYAVIALGGGAAIGLGLGWEAGFSEGTEDSVRRVAYLLKELGLQ